MASHQKFQSDSNKYTQNRSSHNADTNSNVESLGVESFDSFTRNLDKYVDFISWARWYPDLFLDLIRPRDSSGNLAGLNLHFDQRVFLRCVCRFMSVYGVFPRGWGKTFDEVLAFNVICILFPNITVSVTAQTKENAAKILKDKQKEICDFYPIIKDEIYNEKYSKNDAEVVFLNKSTIDILANAQTSKGQRRRRINIEESALLNNELFEDALEPIVEIGRMTAGSLGVIDPLELNQNINFFSTSGFRNSDEYNRNLAMIKSMSNLEGKIVLGSDWRLGCWYGRGSSKTQILQKKKTMSPIMFGMNYESRWVGSSSGALININKLLSLRTLKDAHTEKVKSDEYLLAIDVARSENTTNNRTSVAVLSLKRKSNGNISTINVVNIIDISNTLSFTNQAIEIKRLKNLYECQILVIDGNGLGAGLVDALLLEHMDPITGENLGCFNTINTDATPETSNAISCLYDLKAQSSQSDIITAFIDSVESSQLRLLIKKVNADYDIDDRQNYEDNILPFIQTDFFIEETANLKLKTLPSAKLALEKTVKRVGKDRFSAVSYGVWYARTFLNFENDDDQYDSFEDFFVFV